MAFRRVSIIAALLASLVPTSIAAQYVRRSCINKDCTAVRATIHNPPVNLWDVNVITEFGAFLKELNTTNHTKVVVVSSDVPDFFVTQIDLTILSPGPGSAPFNATKVLDEYYEGLDLLLASPVIFIGEVNGRAWGAGDEHLMRMDMRFAGPDAQFGAPEAAVGLIHVGGLQQLVRLIGPGLAAEYMLSAAQVPAKEAARIGWVNAAFTTKQALESHVDQLAARIAKFHIEGLRATKASIAEQAPPRSALQDDLKRFTDLSALPFVAKNVAEILVLSNNQSRAWELNNNDNVVAGLY